jgi:ribosomal protein S18 acetylase RimI-like enzyme
MQFTAQQRWYEQAYPEAETAIIMLAREPIGRMIVAKRSSDILLVDISLLPERRNCGIGTELLARLKAESQQSGLPVRLQVFKDNRALRLYQRLGFAVVTNDGMYRQMEWKPDTAI